MTQEALTKDVLKKATHLREDRLKITFRKSFERD